MHHEPTNQSPNPGGRISWMARAFAAAAVLVAIVAAGGCSSSPKEILIESADKKCDTINDRFAKDLAYGQTIGTDDMTKMRERIVLIEDLQNHVRKLPAPESATDQEKLDVWLSQLDAYADELNTMHNLFENYLPGSDMLIAMTAGVVKEKAKKAGTAAMKLGLDSCARTERWEYLPPE